MSAALLPVYRALIVTCILAGLFFLRYWRLSGDGFFVWFACAFWTFAVCSPTTRRSTVPTSTPCG